MLTEKHEKIEKESELDLKITDELKDEGMVREMVRFLQGMRKDLELKPVDKISIFIYDSSRIILSLNFAPNFSKNIYIIFLKKFRFSLNTHP